LWRFCYKAENDPFFKKKGAGAEVPIAMTGTYEHSRFTAGLK
jgi:hypothetical protein